MEHYVLTIGINPEHIPYIQQETESINAVLISATDIWDGIRYFSQQSFSLVVVDLHTAQHNDCIELMATLRRTGFVPVLALINYENEDMASDLLEWGIDVCQPHTIPSRLLAKQIKTSLRRYTVYGRYDKPEDDLPFQRGDIYIDPRKRTAHVRGRSVQLRPREFSLLKYFMHNPNIVLTTEMICDRAWDGEYSGDVGRAVYDLRQRIEPDPAHPIYILTEYRIGYRFTGYSSETCDEKESNRKTLGK